MKKHFFTFLLLISCAFSVSAQDNEARKVDEFGTVSCDDYLARMDSAIQESTNNPSATVYILIYEGKEVTYNARTKKEEPVLPILGSTKAKIASIKEYLALRKISAEKFSFIDAGFRENPGVEIWLVPKGAVPPKPTPTIEKMKFRKGNPRRFCTYCC